MIESDKKLMESQWDVSYLADGNAPYLEALYEEYLQDPNAIDPAWRQHFETMPAVNGYEKEVSHSKIQDAFRELALQGPAAQVVSPASMVDVEHESKQVRVLQLINAYRFRGHQRNNFDPLGLKEADEIEVPDLHLAYHGLSETDLDIQFETGSFAGHEQCSLGEIISSLNRIYCGSIGCEYMHITDTAEKRWIQGRLESGQGLVEYAGKTKRWLLGRITAAEGLERYLHNKYIGQKRFSLEGAEAMIPLLEEIVQRAGGSGVKEVIIGMAHRGRLNVLVNVLGKLPTDLFLEFEGKAKIKGDGSGDVKYHQGFSSNLETPGGHVHVALAFNPSHLEIVCPVVEGSVRARQERWNDKDGSLVVPILVHGDAAFAGQGVVMETFNMSQSRGYSTKGTLHIIVNNQIGFTTSNQRDSRSTLYSSDVAKIVNAPIFHVNGDDPEAVLFVTRLATDYRMTFRKDVVIDLVCYRRHGHSEADEPSVTQPVMYRKIKETLTTRAIYAQQLTDEGVIASDEGESHMARYRESLDRGDCVVPTLVEHDKADYRYAVDWTPYEGGDYLSPVATGVAIKTMSALFDKISTLPPEFVLHPAVVKVMDSRRKMSAGAMSIDWGFAENMAYATLLHDGYGVRLSGQDSGRGTFFHRHAALHNQIDDAVHMPLRELSRELHDGVPRFLVTNSLLSEEAVLAFEYGYATASPATLPIWEAQFGDFANNAQVVIDQFISAGEHKWRRLCGLVMLLPHGYEGQGPEHSSARLERYLQLCAEHNMKVCVPTTPAQIFHLLRYQMLCKSRKPLIVLTPKSLLRHRLAVSSLEDLSEGVFQPVIAEHEALDAKAVTRVLLCSGKVYYDLLEKRTEDERRDVAIIRLEQVYPLPKTQLSKILVGYPNAVELVWCQEEPKNQGAWYYCQRRLDEVLDDTVSLHYAGRPPSAAPAVGAISLHIQQLKDLLATAFGALN